MGPQAHEVPRKRYLAAMANDQQREAALLTFLCAASGLTIGGVGSSFWGLVAGGLVMLASTR